MKTDLKNKLKKETSEACPAKKEPSKATPPAPLKPEQAVDAPVKTKVQPGCPEVAALMRQYSRKKVIKVGEHLDLGDALLFAEKRGKKLGLIVDNSPRQLEISDVKSYLKTVPFLQAELISQGFDRADADSWLLLSVSADYDPTSAVRNHWMPCFTSEQLSALGQDFFLLTSVVEAETRKMYVHSHNELTKWELGDPSSDVDTDPEVAAEMMEGLKLECNRHLVQISGHGSPTDVIPV